MRVRSTHATREAGGTVQTPSKKWDGIYPPVLPPPDFFNEEEEIEKQEAFFHKDEAFTNPLPDETGTVHLPHDEKGFCIWTPRHAVDF